MAYQRGSGSVELELSRVQSCLEILDPQMDDLAKKVDSLESSRDKLDARIAIIVWLVGINITLMVGLILSLFAWGLNHITLKVLDEKPQISHESKQQLSIDPPPSY